MNTITNKRNAAGVKYSCDQYRGGGERVLWVDGRYDDATLRIVNEIRAAGFKCWRTKDQVWVRSEDLVKIPADVGRD